MRIYLDDERKTPDGWHRCYWPDEVIELLKTGEVTEISLDHDLGNDFRGTGYDVLVWLENEVITNGFKPPRISLHTQNIVGKERMKAACRSIRTHVMNSRSKEYDEHSGKDN